jgi:hypothetical protein
MLSVCYVKCALKFCYKNFSDLVLHLNSQTNILNATVIHLYKLATTKIWRSKTPGTLFGPVLGGNFCHTAKKGRIWRVSSKKPV